MEYPFKYPELYAELARQGKDKTSLAENLGITLAALRYKQSIATTGDFTGAEIIAAAKYLNVPASKLFGMELPA